MVPCLLTLYNGCSVSVWQFGGVELNVDILREKPDIPSYYERVTGGNILRFQFIGFMPTTPPTNAFDIPPECKM